MMLHHGPKPEAAYADMLRRLVETKGLKRYAFFFMTEEGRRLPNGLEDVSGYVVDATGRVFSFWTGWDAEHGVPAFRHWDQVQPESDWLEEEDYREALDAVGVGSPGSGHERAP
jgi:hypothetical protein